MQFLKGNNELTIQTMEKYSESFIEYLDERSELTLKAYKVGIASLMGYLKDNNITQPTRNDIKNFRDELKNNYSSNTVNTYMIAVRKLFKYLSLNNLYENVAEDIKGCHYDTTPKKEVLSQEQLRTIYSSLTDKREKALFSLMITTGLRTCEVQTALIEDIREHNGEMVLFVLGKKRSSKCDYVKLSDEVLRNIYDYIGNRTTGSIFVSQSNENFGEGITSKTIRQIIKKIFKRFGLERDTLSCHSLRRSFAVLSYENGSDIYSIKDVLRHQSINTTTRYLKQVDRDKNKTELMVSNVLFEGGC